MIGVFIAAGWIVTAQVGAGHDGNAVFRGLRAEGWKVGETRVEFPVPLLSDNASADEERAALRTVAGSDRAVADLVRDSVTAPVVIKTHDLKVEGGVVRQAELWFVVRAELDAIDPDKFGGKGEPVEAGNMRFEAREVTPEELAKLGLTVPKGNGRAREWYVRSTGRLLDRIQAEATDRVTATRTKQSWVIASRTEPRFDNRWWPIVRKGGKEEQGRAEPYAGGASVTAIRRLSTVPGALLVEARFAFYEPRAWFDGAPTLRSKIGVVAQDRVRGMRRELAKSRNGPPVRNPSGSGAG